jgi:hypothetical protein
MFVVGLSNAKAARKMSILMAVACLVTGSFGLLLTMHFIVNPSRRPTPKGLRFWHASQSVAEE